MSPEDNITYDPAGFSHLVSLDPDGNLVFNKEEFLSFLQTDQEGFYILLNWPEKKILEVSPSVKTITGYSKEKFANGGFDFYNSLCHPCERAFIKYVHKEILMFYNSLAPAERLKYQYTFDAIICKPNGKDSRLFCQLFCLKMDEAFNPLFVVGYFTPVRAGDQKYVTLVIKKIDGELKGKEIEFKFKTHSKPQHSLVTEEAVYNKSVINQIDVIQNLNATKIYSIGKNVLEEEKIKYDTINLE